MTPRDHGAGAVQRVRLSLGLPWLTDDAANAIYEACEAAAADAREEAAKVCEEWGATAPQVGELTMVRWAANKCAERIRAINRKDPSDGGL